MPDIFAQDVVDVNIVLLEGDLSEPEKRSNVAAVNTERVEFSTIRMGKPKSYHHGNLREALLESAIRLIAEVGPAAFTLREVARRAGVSHNAPYRHFHDKDDLLAAVAAQGYRELTAAMTAAAESELNPRNRLKQAGLAYVSFALRRPEHFTVMFDAPSSKQQRPEAADAAKRAFATLLDFVQQCQERKQLPSGDPLAFALLAWTWVHGIAKLAITGRLPYRSKAKILRFAEFVIDESLPANGRANR